MRINGKDVAAGGLLLLLAVVGLWLNTEHTLGTARRMGPGYMPLLVFLIQVGLGVIILGMGLFNGPDPLERWAYKENFIIMASICVFALLLERAGLMLAVAGCCLVSAFADREHRPVGAVIMTVFLMGLCWLVFIRALDIRVPVWPVGY